MGGLAWEGSTIAWPAVAADGPARKWTVSAGGASSQGSGGAWFAIELLRILPQPLDTSVSRPETRPIGNDEKTYSDEQFALILRKASEMSRSQDSSSTARSASEVLSLAEMKEIAAEAGLDPVMVEKAARLLPDTHHSTGLERLIGAPVKIRMGAEFDAPLTLERAEGLLALVRASAEQQGEGDATGSGVTWHSVGEGTQMLVSIHAEGERTHLRVVADRRGALAISGGFSLMASLAVGVVVVLASEISGVQAHPLVGVGLMAGGAGGVFGAARAIWKSTSRRVHARVASLMDTLGRSLERLEDGGG
jgi:hypothetical protein